MKILLDTNILIPREDDVELDENLQKLMRLIQKEGYSIFVHPGSVIDVKKDSNERRRRIVLSKIKAYPQLENPPDYGDDDAFKDKIPNFQNLNSNDVIDLSLLYSLYRDAVSFLITDDRKIRKWARIFNVETCHSVREAIEFFREPNEKKVKTPYPIDYVSFSNLKLEDTFFDSLKDDYADFKKWFRKKAQEGRKAYVYFNEDKSLGAFLSLKEEKNARIESKPKPIHKKSILKISTLKVTKNGDKIGEQFLSIAFRHAMDKGIDEIYLTHFIKENDDRLVDLIETFGFEKSKNHLTHEYTDLHESIFLKKLCTTEACDPEKLRKTYFPSFYDGSETKKFIVPIKPEWNGRLFPDQRTQTSLPEHLGEFFVEGNTIKKAYLCHSKSRKIKKDSVLIFYQSTKNQKLTSIGLVDKVKYGVKSAVEARGLVAKRTVYTHQEIKKLLERNPLTIIIFSHHFPLERQLSKKDLELKKIIKRPPRSIAEISDEKYRKIKAECKIPKKFTHREKKP